MPAIISTSDVRQALRPSLGSEMVDHTAVAVEAAHVLRAYAAYRDTFFTLHQRLCDVIFSVLYGTLGASMTVRLDDGGLRRIRLCDLPDIADDAMYAFFTRLTVYSVNYQSLKDYSLRAGSLSAMRVLMERYDAFQPPEETALMAQIIREGYPPQRYLSWLKQPPAPSHRPSTDR